MVDTKSIMGIFSLDLSRPVCIVFHKEIDYNLMFDFMNSYFPVITERREI